MFCVLSGFLIACLGAIYLYNKGVSVFLCLVFASVPNAVVIALINKGTISSELAQRTPRDRE